MSGEKHNLRAVLVKIPDLLSNSDRQRLHYFLAKDVSKDLCDDLTLTGTFHVLEFLFNKTIITDQDCFYLIDALEKTSYHDAAKRLLEYQQAQQKNDKRDFILQDMMCKNYEAGKIQLSKISPGTINSVPILYILTMPKGVSSECGSTYSSLPIIGDTEEHHRFSRLTAVFKQSLKSREMILLILILLLLAFSLIMIFWRNPRANIKTSRAPLRDSVIDADVIWSQTGTVVAGGNGPGNSVNQLSYPYGLYVDDDRTIYVANEQNHRIIAWDHGATSGQVVAGGNGAGNRTDQLNRPTDVIVDKESNSIIICDYGNGRVVRWPRHGGTSGQILISNGGYIGLTMDNRGFLYVTDQIKNNIQRWRIEDTYTTVVAGGNGKGDRLDQFDEPRYIFVDQDYSVYVSDWNNDRVMKWMAGAKEGIIVAGGQGKGNTSRQLSSPEGVVVDQLGTVYVVDQWNHRIMRWPKGTTRGNVVVGGNNMKDQAKQIYRPVGLSFDRRGNLYVVEHGNHRIQKFNID